MEFPSTVQYILGELRNNATDTMWWRGRIVDHINSPFQCRLYPGYSGSTRVMNEDWDNLLILDGCRADLFEDVADVATFDEYSQKKSFGSTTEEWTRNNFGEDRFGDTVYITSNPYTTKVAGDSFHKLINVWESSFDDTTSTVHPEPLISEARRAVEEYPNKRIVVHFMQPHYPFVGSDEFVGAGMNPDQVMDGTIGGSRKQTAWRALAVGEVPKDTVWRAYRDNLEYVLEPALQLAGELGGKSVVSSDHGNMIGERSYPVPVRLYGHPGGLRHRPLVDIPWAVVEDENRRRIIDDGVTRSVGDDEEIAERLRDLGYAE